MRNFDDIFNKLILMEIIVTSVFSILIFESILFVRKLSEINLFYSLTQNIDLDLDNGQTLIVTTQDINALEAFHFSEHSIEDQLDTSTFAELFSPSENTTRGVKCVFYVNAKDAPPLPPTPFLGRGLGPSLGKKPCE